MNGQTCELIISRFISCADCFKASINFSCSIPLNWTPGNTSRMRESNRLLSAKVSLDKVLSLNA